MWGNIISGIGSLAGGYLANRGAQGAADAQAGATAANNATSERIYQQQRADQMPWMVAGAGALNQLYEGMNSGALTRRFTGDDFQADPGYAFRLAEGEKALNRQASARGAYLDPSTMKVLQKYGGDLASAEYGNAYNRFNADRTDAFNKISSIAGTGQAANQMVGNAAQNYGSSLASNNNAAAGAQAGLALSQGQIYGDMINNLAATGYNYYARK
jgi:hypothetical protein